MGKCEKSLVPCIFVVIFIILFNLRPSTINGVKGLNLLIIKKRGCISHLTGVAVVSTIAMRNITSSSPFTLSRMNEGPRSIENRNGEPRTLDPSDIILRNLRNLQQSPEMVVLDLNPGAGFGNYVGGLSSLFAVAVIRGVSFRGKIN